MKRIPEAVSIAASVAAIVLSGCSEDPTKPSVEDPRKSVEGVMQALIDAIEGREMERYASLFHSKEFRFVFDRGDVIGNRELPPYWEWTEETAAIGALFRSPYIDRVSLDFVIESSVPATPDDEDRRAFPEGTIKVTVTDVDLVIEMRDPDGGEDIRFITDRDAGEYFLAPDSTEIVDGVAVWKILEWRDKNVRVLSQMVIDASWGTIKEYFAPYPLTTPRGTLSILLRTYNVRDLLAHYGLFDRERFEFVFDGRDVQEDPSIPESWGWPEEQVAYQNLFESNLLEAIDLEFTIGTPVPVTAADIGSRPFPEGTVKLSLSDVDLTVRMRDPAGGDTLVFLGAVGEPTFFLYPNPNATYDGVPLWTIFEWRDERGSEGFDRPTLSLSWGRLKSMFQ